MQQFLKESHLQEAIAALDRLVAIPSVCNEEEAEPGAPFGTSIREALETALALCEEIGMKTYIDPDGYYGYAEIGEGEECFASLAHLDVVPAGDLSLWDSNPFVMRQENGRLYGRGTQDDKGPAIAALIALKALLDAGVQFKRKLRFIFGTDEETLWRCMAAYGKKEKWPDMGITPDSSFPLTFAEKGLLQCQLIGNGSNKLSLNVGDAFNIVPNKAFYTGDSLAEIEQALQELHFKYEKKANGIEVHGKSKHAMDAENGINAISRLSIALHKVGIDSNAVRFIAEMIGEDAFAEKIFGPCEDAVSGKLKFNIGCLKIAGNEEVISIDMRIPVTVEKEKLVEKLAEAATKYGLTYKQFDWLAPLYVPKDSELVKGLMTIYREMTGDDTEPRASGGATYARAMENAVAFGMAFPDTILTEHQPNEYIEISNLSKGMDIYAETFYRFCCK